MDAAGKPALCPSLKDAREGAAAVIIREKKMNKKAVTSALLLLYNAVLL